MQLPKAKPDHMERGPVIVAKSVRGQEDKAAASHDTC